MISLAVQQMPDRLMPLAPLATHFLVSSSSLETMAMMSERVGSWPCTTTLTQSFLSTPRLARVVRGLGRLKITSDSSVPIMEPPQPSASAVRSPCLITFL